MAYSVVQHTSGSGSGSELATSRSLPGAPTAGNLLIAYAAIGGATPSSYTINTADWSVIERAMQIDGTENNIVCLGRYVQSGDTSAMPKFLTAGSGFNSWMVQEISGVQGNLKADILCTDSNYQGGAAATVTTRSLQTIAANSFAVCGAVNYNSGSNITFDVGWTADERANNSGNYGSWECGHKAIASAGAVTCAITYPSSDRKAYVIVVLTPTAPAQPQLRRKRLLTPSGSGASRPGSLIGPGAPIVGDLTIAVLHWNGGSGSLPTIAAGWTQFAQSGPASNDQCIGIYRYNQSGDTELTPAITTTGNTTFWAITFFDIQGVTGTFATDVAFADFHRQASGASITTTSETAPANGTLAIIAPSNYNASAVVTWSTGWVHQDGTDSSIYGSWSAAWEYFNSGDTIQATITAGNSATSLAYGQIVFGAPSADVTITPGKGVIEIVGYAPTAKIDFVVTPGAGAIGVVGYAPIAGQITYARPGKGEIEIVGYDPTIVFTAAVLPGAGALEIKGLKAFVQENNISEVAVLTLAEIERDIETSETAILTMGEVIPEIEDSELAVLTMGEVVPVDRVTEIVVLALVDVRNCTSTKLQGWRITRRDGTVLRFTSLDVDYIWAGETFKACKSLNPSASDESSALGQVGSIELAGLISDESITEKDLYGGLYDDAFVEVWLLDFSGDEFPRLLASGWTGNLSHSDSQFSMEVLGAGARLNQTPITRNYGPDCRFEFGGTECQFDKEALTISGTIVQAKSRAQFIIDLGYEESESSVQWVDGEIRFSSGDNDGIVCEIRSLTFGDEVQISLWSAAEFVPLPGDTFTLVPGCRRDYDTCQGTYGNGINFGGFKDVPGNDAMNQTPDAKE